MKKSRLERLRGIASDLRRVRSKILEEDFMVNDMIAEIDSALKKIDLEVLAGVDQMELYC